jgi:hypothetical protein
MTTFDASLLRWITRGRAWASKPRVQRTGTGVALLVFAAGIVYAWLHAEIDPGSVRAAPLVAIAILSVVSAYVSGLQVQIIARAGGRRIGFSRALRLVVYGSLSSVLPVSSGTLVRAGAFVVWGIPIGRTANLLMIDALVWLAFGLLCTGLAMAVVVGSVVAAIPLAAAALTAAGWIFMSRRLFDPRGQAWLATTRAAGVVIDVLRLFAGLAALQVPASIMQAGALAAAPPVASLFFMLPSGLGVVEGVTAGLAATVSLSAAGAFLAAGLVRILGLMTLLCWEAGRRGLIGLHVLDSASGEP